MSWVFVVLAVVAGGLLLWTLLDPRGSWRVLVGWAMRDPSAAEPGDAIHAIRRVVAGIGLAGLLAVGGVTVVDRLAEQPRPAPAPSALEEMWGAPAPRLLDRAVTPRAEPPEGLVAGSVVAVQETTPGRAPVYLLTMPRWTRLGDPSPSGIVGVSAPDGQTSYSMASLLVSVRGPLLCIPRAVVVQETEEDVTVGVWFGMPDGEGELDHVAGCAGDPNAEERILIAVPLADELGDRDVLTLDGALLRVIPTPSL